MKVTPEITYRDVSRSEWIDDYVDRYMEKLDRICDDIVACRIAIERVQHHKEKGNPYRVRVEVTLPGKKDLVADKRGPVGDPQVQLRPIIRQAFEAVEKQLKKQMAKRRGEVKNHRTGPRAIVVRVFDREGYGFLKTPEGEEVYFHRNAVLHDDFERLTPGAEVRFEPEMGDDGLQASIVQIVSKPGVLASKKPGSSTGVPAGWER